MSVTSAVTLNGHRMFLFLYNFKVNSANVRFTCLAAQTLPEQSSVKVFFITQIGHRPRASNSKRGLKKETGPHYDYSRASIWRWRKKGCTWNLLETAFASFFLRMISWVNREFICSPLHVRSKQLCPTRGPVESFLRPIFSFSCSDKYPTCWQPLLILIIFNLPFFMQAVLSTTLTRGITRGAQFPGRPVTMGAPNDYRVAEKS